MRAGLGNLLEGGMEGGKGGRTYDGEEVVSENKVVRGRMVENGSGGALD